MDKRFTIISSFAVLLGCQSAPVQQEEPKIFLEPETEMPMSRHSEEAAGELPVVEIKDYLMYSDLRINNRLPMGTTLPKVVSLFGKPDSVHTPDYEDGCNSCHFCLNETPPPIVFSYFEGLEFEQLKDSLVFWSVDFAKSPTVFLQFGNVRLDRSTTINQFRQRFPDASKRIEQEKEGFKIWIDATNIPVDGGWVLQFSNERKLKRISYWFPC